jgi:hypothetical protein
VAVRGNLHRALLDKEMTRKEFLQIVGGSLVVIFGVANFVKLLHHYTQPAEAQKPALASKASNGFGARKFGV